MKKFIEEALDAGFVPYVATSKILESYFDLSLFGGKGVVKLLEDPAQRDFHEAYLLSNSLAFGNPDLKMPGWVYIDCVLMQSAVVGFALPVARAPSSLLSFYERDPSINLDKLDYIPVSGQIAGLGIDGQTLVGYSLFSLRQHLGDMALSQMAARTKYAALSVYRAEEKEKFTGISQYDNKALTIHALFGDKMYIDQTVMPLHPLKDMSFTYSMKVRLDEERIFGRARGQEAACDFLLKAYDRAMKDTLQQRINQGEKFYITEPVYITKEDGLYLPICEEKR